MIKISDYLAYRLWHGLISIFYKLTMHEIYVFQKFRESKTIRLALRKKYPY